VCPEDIVSAPAELLEFLQHVDKRVKVSPPRETGNSEVIRERSEVFYVEWEPSSLLD
jgi:hypothetical protein